MTDLNHWSNFTIPFCTCSNVANWTPGQPFTICENCNHPDRERWREPCLSDEAMERLDSQSGWVSGW